MLLDYSLVFTPKFSQNLVIKFRLTHVIGIQRLAIFVLLSCDGEGRNDCSARHFVVDSNNIFRWSNVQGLYNMLEEHWK